MNLNELDNFCRSREKHYSWASKFNPCHSNMTKYETNPTCDFTVVNTYPVSVVNAAFYSLYNNCSSLKNKNLFIQLIKLS